jgi:hypothetical protein
MERMEGDTLKHHVGTAPLDIEKIVDVVIQVADALDAAHARASSTATSSLPTSSIQAADRRRSSTSAWRSWLP